MSMINCPECGKEISDKATNCPNCGCPSSEWKSECAKNLENDIYIECGKDRKIEIKNNIMSVDNPVVGEISDKIENFTLEYFGISMGVNVGICIYNRKMKYTSGIFDVVANGEKLERLKEFKEIMVKNGLFSGRSRSDMIYKKTKEDKELQENMFNVISKKRTNIEESKTNNFKGIYRSTLFYGLQEVYCPRCGSDNCSHYQEQKIIPAKAKTRYTANLNPLKPFTLVNKKERVVRKENVVTESKFVCNNCGKIFN